MFVGDVKTVKPLRYVEVEIVNTAAWPQADNSK